MAICLMSAARSSSLIVLDLRVETLASFIKPNVQISRFSFSRSVTSLSSVWSTGYLPKSQRAAGCLIPGPLLQLLLLLQLKPAPHLQPLPFDKTTGLLVSAPAGRIG